jgi:hypothetical protein
MIRNPADRAALLDEAPELRVEARERAAVAEAKFEELLKKARAINTAVSADSFPRRTGASYCAAARNIRGGGEP